MQEKFETNCASSPTPKLHYSAKKYFWISSIIPSLKLHGTMDTKLRQQGIGAQLKHTGYITPNEEELFWKSGILGVSSPLALRSVFYYNGKVFCLRGGDEHRQLKFSQLKRDSKGYVYTENGSKNRSGGLAQMKIDNKVVPSYAVKENGDRWHVNLLDLCMKKVPKEAITKDLP